MPEDEEDSFKEFFRNKLKDTDTANLERANADAVSLLVETKLECSIDSIDYHPGHSSTRAKIT